MNLDIHNTTEDTVVKVLEKVFDEIQKGGNPENLCLCQQCKLDTLCFTLNRIQPHYIVSNRGLSRIEKSSIKHQQAEADITSLIYKGVRLVNHNMRPNASHFSEGVQGQKSHLPVFDLPTISGRIFNGVTFEPAVDIKVELYCDGELVKMRNSNWQNPFTMVSSTPGAYSFWPATIHAEQADVKKVFKFSIRVNSPDYEILNHFFDIESVSRFHTPSSYALNKTRTMPDLYVFPPGGDEDDF